MQRKLAWFLLTGLLVLLIGCSAARNAEPVASDDMPIGQEVVGSVDEPAVDEAVVAPGNVGIVEDAMDSALPVQVERAAGMGMGGGGGGGADFMTNAEFNLTVPFPTDVTQTTIYSVSNAPQSITLEEARAMAARMGFTGEAYLEWYPGAPLPEAGVERAPEGMPYVFFDNGRRLTFFGSSVSLENQAASRGTFFGTMPRSELIATAEQYVADLGLIDFEYEVVSTYGNDVQFRRMLDGRSMDYAELNVTMNDAGQVAWLNYQPLQPLTSLGEFELIAAEDAWQSWVDERSYQGMYYNLFPSDAQRQAMNMPQMGPQTHWERAQIAQGDVAFIGWPQMYRPASGSGDPIVLVNGMRITADSADLEAIGQAGQALFITGRVTTDANGNQVMNISSWEVSLETSDISMSGRIVREGDEVFLRVNGGQRFLMPDAPAELADNARVYSYGWGIRDAGTGIPVFEWMSLDQQPTSDGPMPTPLPAVVSDPYVFEMVTIEEIDLMYRMVWPGDPMLAEGVDIDYDTQVIQPMWRFSGTTDSGAHIEIFVSAVAGR